jgi:hypothetical protein
MSLDFYLVHNQMTPDPDDFMAVSSNSESYSIEDVFDQMTREGSTITKAEALASFEEISQAIIKLVKQGCSITTPLFNISSSVSGIFNSEEDNFVASKHQVRINVTAGTRLNAVASEITPKKVTTRERRPVPVHYYDNTSETQDQMITSGGGARVTGSLLKFDESDASQGIFFVNTSNSEATRVGSKLLRNKPGELIFLNPALAAGTYRLEIRSLMRDAKDLRRGVLSADLTAS